MKKGIDLEYYEDTMNLCNFLMKNDIALTPKKVEKMYRDYCNETDSAGWITPDNIRMSCFCSYVEERLTERNSYY